MAPAATTPPLVAADGVPPAPLAVTPAAAAVVEPAAAAAVEPAAEADVEPAAAAAGEPAAAAAVQPAAVQPAAAAEGDPAIPPPADPAAPPTAVTAAAVAESVAAGAGVLVPSTIPGTFAMVDKPRPRRVPRRRIAPGGLSTADPLAAAAIPPPEALSGPQVTAVVAPPADYARNLQVHNSYRARHQNTPAMQWDNIVASSAQAYANKCIWGHDSANNAYGENLYVSI